MTKSSDDELPYDEFACANCQGLFDKLEDGREPEELCPTCWFHVEQNLADLKAARAALVGK